MTTLSESPIAGPGAAPPDADPAAAAPAHEPVTPAPRPIRLRRRQRLLGRSSYVLIVGIVFAVGMFVGARYKHAAAAGASTGGAAAGASGTAARATGTGTAAGGFANGGFANGGGGGTSGQITKVDAGTIELTTSAGSTVRVALGTGTVISITKAGAVTDLKVGDTITVQGTTGTDGTVTATRISEGGAAGPGGAASGTTVAGATPGSATTGGTANGAAPANGGPPASGGTGATHAGGARASATTTTG